MKISPQLIDSGENYAISGLVHRVLISEAAGPLPTVVMLHGRLGNEDVMWIFARTIPKNCLIVSVRAIMEEGGNAYSWHPYQAGEWPTILEYEAGVTAVSHFIRTLPQLYNADLNQIYLMGFSQGAATAYATAIHHPGITQGIAGLVGFVPEKAEDALDSVPLSGLPIYMAVGKEDEHISLQMSQTSAKILRMAQADLSYNEYSTGHKLNSQGMRDLTAWWAEQIK